MKFRKLVLGIAALAAVAGPVGSATAAPKAAPKATGSVALADPLQYVTFSAIAGTPVKGNVAYTNFDEPSPNTGVWDVASWSEFVFDGGYDWTISVGQRVATSTTSETFTGVATFEDPTYTADVAGSVVGNLISYTLDYTGEQADTVWTVTGTIQPDGSISGTGTLNDTDGTTLAWSAPSGSATEVHSFTAPVECVSISDNRAEIGYVVPDGNPYGGWGVVYEMTDGGSSGAGNDTWAQTAAEASAPVCDASTGGSNWTQFPVTAGNLTVHNR